MYIIMGVFVIMRWPYIINHELNEFVKKSPFSNDNPLALQTEADESIRERVLNGEWVHILGNASYRP